MPDILLRHDDKTIKLSTSPLNVALKLSTSPLNITLKHTTAPVTGGVVTDYNNLTNKPDLSIYATKIDVDTSLAGKSDVVHVHTVSDVTGLQAALDGKQATGDYASSDDLDSKQDMLISGTNIKTVNGSSLLGAGDIEIAGGSGAVDSVNGATGEVVLDADDIDDTSTTNKFVTAADITKLSDLYGINTGDQDLSGYATTASLSTVATSGDYSDLNNTPTIPTNNNQLTNGAGYITDYTVTESDVTAHQAALTITESQISDLSHFSGSYSDLSNVPTSFTPSAHTHDDRYYTKTEVDAKDTDVANTAQTNLTAHTSNTSNPHNVTKAQVGLGNVDNTSDSAKPISTATQTALNAKADDSAVVKLTGNQTVAGVKTFSSSPIVPTATTNTQAVNKQQMDTADALKVSKSGDTMTGRLIAPSYSVDGALVLSGLGFPNGVVSAPVGSKYIDKNATNGAIEWIKTSGTGNTGWSVIYGDSGWRNVPFISANDTDANVSTMTGRLRFTESATFLEFTVVTSGTVQWQLRRPDISWASYIPDTSTGVMQRMDSHHLSIVTWGRRGSETYPLRKFISLPMNGLVTGTWKGNFTAPPADTWPTTLPGTAV